MPKKIMMPFWGSYRHTQAFGVNPQNYEHLGLIGHNGDDWALPVGTPLYAPFDGVILRGGRYDMSGGVYTDVWDTNQLVIAEFAHLSSQIVPEGQTVVKGQKISLSGDSGRVTGPHLHLAIYDTDENRATLNVQNGYNGAYSILDKSKVDLLPFVSKEVPTTETPPAPTEITGEYDWQEIYQNYYAGWDETAAKANFKDAYGNDIVRLREARGEAPPDERGNPMATYYIKPAFAGKTLKEIQKETGQAFRTDVLAAFMGINENDVIEANRGFGSNQQPKLSDTGSGETVAFLKFFSTTLTTPPPVITQPPVTTQPPPAAPPPTADLTEVHTKLDKIMAAIKELADRPIPTAPAPTAPQAVTVTEAGTAFLYVSTVPERASIYIDGQFQGDYTPSNEPHELTPGTHELRIKKSGQKVHRETVDLESGETKTVHIVLQPK